MNDLQKAVIVRAGAESTEGLDELNILLNRGWKVAQVAPMGAAGVGAPDGPAAVHFAALVVLERPLRAEATLDAAEEEIEEVIDDLLEGSDPPTIELDDDFGPEDLN